MNRYFIATGTSLLVLAGLFSVHTAYACSPAPGYPLTASAGLATSNIAFIGTVQSVAKDSGANGDYKITFSVNNVLKGMMGKIVTVATRSSSAACGYNDATTAFAPGTVWGIFTSGTTTDGYSTNSLSGNTMYASVDAANAALTGTAITSVSATSTSGLMMPAPPSGPMPATDLSYGSRGEGVTWLQQYLMSLRTGTKVDALISTGATGYFGNITRAALIEFQEHAGITPSAGYFGMKTRAYIASTTPSTIINDDAPATTFTGKIEAVDTGCFADATCSVTVGGKKIVLARGMRIGVSYIPTGTLIGINSIGDIQANIGKTVQVFAAEVTDDSTDGPDFTLIGSSDYFVKLVGDVPANGIVSVPGTIGCLPPLNRHGIHSMICALGLTGNDGNYYALKDPSASYATIHTAPENSHVVVNGTFTAETSPSFASVGTIEVTSIK